MREDVLLIWGELLQAQFTDQGFECRRIFPEAACDIFLAVRKPENIPCLILEVASASIEPEMRFPESKGFIVWPSAIEHGSRGRIRLVLEMRNSKFDKIFSVLVTDIADALAIVKTEKGCIHELINRLVLWQTFLEKCGPEGLDETDQQGLFGELIFLESFLLKNLPPSRVVNSWVGPTGANQDFNINGDAIEVKTSVAVSPKSIHVSNIMQLDTKAVKRLILVFMALDRRQGNERTLPSLIEVIRNILKEGDLANLNVFDERLREAGYLDIHRDLYCRTNYTVRFKHYYLVEGNFPRLLEDGMPTGVEDVKYSISIVACSPYKIPETSFANMLKEGL